MPSILILILSLALNSFSFLAHAEEPAFNSQVNERIEIPVETSSLQKNDATLVIQVGKINYTIANATTDPLAIARFNSMPANQQQQFYQNRDRFLSGAAKVLRSVGWTFGIGSLIADKIVMFKEKTKPPETRQDRSQRIITSLLSGLNRQLWAQAPVVGNANEFGLNLSLGLAAESGTSSKGWGGQFDIGISFGYNKESKSFVFQIYRNIEKFKTTILPAIFYVGVNPKASFFASQTSEGQIQSRLGFTTYAPGAPLFVSTSPTMMASGASLGIGFPPPPFGDMLSYTNELDHKALVRITVSPLLKGFVRLQFGVDQQSLKIFLQPIMIVKSWLERIGSGLCKFIFVK